MSSRALLALAAAWVSAPGSARALEVPRLVGHVNDQAGVLAPADRTALESKLADYERTTGHQVALLIVPALEDDPIENFSMRVVESWKLGGAKFDDGVLMVVALAERQVRIEVGYGLEGAVPDALAAQIIRDVVVPAFGRQDFAGGIDAGMGLLMRAASGEQVHVPKVKRRGGFDPLHLVLVFLFIGLPLLRNVTRGGRRGVRGSMASGLLTGMLLGGMSSRGGRGGSFGGGGFSGGGGRFGGGGATGGW
ncbi:MAG: TPM domain-containing protein [Myxococcota bacterium]